MNNILRQYLLQKKEISERRSKIHKKLLVAYEKYYQIKLDFNTTETIFSDLPYEDYEEKIYLKGFFQYHLELADHKMPEPDDKTKLSQY